MKGKKFFWNKESQRLEEYHDPNGPEVFIPFNLRKDPDHFQRGLAKIRETIGSGGPKRSGFKLSPPRKGE